MLEIKVLIDKGGIFQGLYVSPQLKDAVELIDFVTTDPDEYDEAEKKMKEADKRKDAGKLAFIY